MKIIAGPLMGLKGQIIKADSRKDRANVSLSFINVERIVELGIGPIIVSSIIWNTSRYSSAEL